MIDFVRDDGGRSEAGFGGRTGDCAVRALAIIGSRFRGELSAAAYRACYDSLFGTEEYWKNIYYKAGLIEVKLPPGPRPTFTEAHKRYGDCIIKIAVRPGPGHVCAVVRGALRDTSDWRWRDKEETEERKVGSVWVWDSEGRDS